MPRREIVLPKWDVQTHTIPFGCNGECCDRGDLVMQPASPTFRNLPRPLTPAPLHVLFRYHTIMIVCDNR